MKKVTDDYLNYLHEGEKINAALYAAGKTANIITKPLRWAGGAAAKAAGRGIKAGASSMRNKMIQSIKNRYKKFKNRKNIPKRPKTQGAIGALAQGIKGK